MAVDSGSWQSMPMPQGKGEKWVMLGRGLGSELAAGMGSFPEPLQKSRRDRPS